MFRHTPAYESLALGFVGLTMDAGWVVGVLAGEVEDEGVWNRTSRISPTLAASGFVREKSRVRAPVGSRMAIWAACRSLIGSGKRLRVEGGGG